MKRRLLSLFFAALCLAVLAVSVLVMLVCFVDGQERSHTLTLTVAGCVALGCFVGFCLATWRYMEHCRKKMGWYIALEVLAGLLLVPVIFYLCMAIL